DQGTAAALSAAREALASARPEATGSGAAPPRGAGRRFVFAALLPTPAGSRDSGSLEPVDLRGEVADVLSCVASVTEIAFAGDGDADLVVLQASRLESAVAVTEAQLGAPGDLADLGGLPLLADLQRAA